MGGAPDVLAALRVETSRGAHRPPTTAATPTTTITTTTTTASTSIVTGLDETSDNAQARPTEKEEKSRRFAAAQSATTSTSTLTTTTTTTSNRFPTTPRPPHDYRKRVSAFTSFPFLLLTRSTKEKNYHSTSGPGGESVKSIAVCCAEKCIALRIDAPLSLEYQRILSTTAKMFKEVLTKSGRRILKAIKKLSTRSRVVRKSQQISHYEMSPARTNNWSPSYPDPDSVSLSWSIPSLDTKSVDTYLTYVTESMDECSSMCCYCREHDENQRNENRENEMII